MIGAEKKSRGKLERLSTSETPLSRQRLPLADYTLPLAPPLMRTLSKDPNHITGTAQHELFQKHLSEKKIDNDVINEHSNSTSVSDKPQTNGTKRTLFFDKDFEIGYVHKFFCAVYFI